MLTSALSKFASRANTTRPHTTRAMIYSVAHGERVLRCFEQGSPEPVKSMVLPGDPRRVNINSDESLMCIGCEYGGLLVVSLPDLTVLHKSSDYVSGAVFSPTDTVIIAVAGTYPYSIRLFNTSTLKYDSESAPLHTSWVHTLDYSPSGHMISSASQDFTAAVIDSATCALITRLTGHTNTVFYATFIDNVRVVTGLSLIHI